MNNVKISNITQKSFRDSSKKGSKEVKFRSSFKNPLTTKRREFLSEWYTINENYDDKGNIKISSQLQSIVQRDMQNLANSIYQDISKVQLTSNDNITLEKIWSEWHNDRVLKKKVAPKTLVGEAGRFNNHITRFIPRDSLIKNIR